MTNTLFTNVNLFDGSGDTPGPGEVLVQGNRIKTVAKGGESVPREGATVVDGGGATLMPGLCDAHAHFGWNNSSSLDDIGRYPIEEHMLAAVTNAGTYLDWGYTMCVGAAAAKPRMDVVLRNAIDSGQFPGPRMLANGPEIATIGGLGDVNPSHLEGYTFVEIINGPEEMRRCVRKLLKEGVDLIKLNLSGEEITRTARAEQTLMAEDEIAMAMQEAARKGVRACAHARSAESVKLCIKYGIEIIYHASYTDEEGMDLLEANKDTVFVVPGLAWLIQTSYGASEWGVTPEIARDMGYHRELEFAIKACKEMHKRGIRVLPGGDYGFAWTPYGTFAKDLEYFVDRLEFTPMEALVAATKLGGDIMGRPGELGRIAEGYLADMILIDGDPLDDVTILQDQDNILAIMKDGRFHKPPAEPKKSRQTKAA